MAKAELLNPFTEGVSYKDFLSAVKESKKTVAKYCKEILTDEELIFIENELELLNNK